MKLNKILEYLKILAQVKRNFFGELSEESTSETERARLAGMAAAHQDHINDIEQVGIEVQEAIAASKATQPPTAVHEHAPEGITLQ